MTTTTRNWDGIEIVFVQDPDDGEIWYAQVELVNDTQLQRFANLCWGVTCRYFPIYKAWNASSRFSQGSRLGRKLNEQFNVF